ncbi:MAG TPA: SufE family protein [Tepidisphaeraceae bacterium]|nr:SufE family protein [Tepidisphaeraceae bacterium]
MAKTEYLENELSKKLSPMPQEMRIESLRVQGCMSRVYLLARSKPGASDRIEFIGWSDSSTVSGLIVVLQRLFSGQRAADVLGFDIDAFWEKIELGKIISDKRRVGLTGMIRRIRASAEALLRGATVKTD